MSEKTVEIGDKWAANISKAFQDWAEDIEKNGYSDMPIARFDPEPFIEAAFLEGGEAQMEQIGRLLGTAIRFNLRSPEAEAWIKKYAAQEIKYLEASQKKVIQQIILRGFQEGLTSQEQSKLIRQHIGLLPQHVTAVQNYEKALEDIDPTLRERLTERYRKKLLKWRADTIALTEGHTASNEGYREANRGAVSRGVLSPDDWERYWMVTRDKRTCPICQGLSGVRADLPNGDFEGDGRGPPRHPRCRCTEGLRQKSGYVAKPKVPEFVRDIEQLNIHNENLRKLDDLRRDNLGLINDERKILDEKIKAGKNEISDYEKLDALNKKRDSIMERVAKAKEGRESFIKLASKRAIVKDETIDGVRLIEYKEGYKVRYTTSLKSDYARPDEVWANMTPLPDRLKSLVKEIELKDKQPSDVTRSGFGVTYATANERTGKITVYVNPVGVKTSTYAHEAGHILDKALIPKTPLNYSDYTKWQRAMQKDGVQKLTTRYGPNAPKAEDFADAVSQYTVNRERFSGDYPARAEILKRILG